MEAFRPVKGVVLPIDRSNVDTDAIIPKQYLKSVVRSGFGANLFDEWRYLDHGEPGQEHSIRRINPDCILNEKRYTGAEILIARKNFGCGSSREHAVWALHDYGIKVIIASSFADIFFNNCYKNGLLPLVLPDDVIDALFGAIKDEPGYMLEVDLESQSIVTPDGMQYSFELEGFKKHCLINGLDEIALTLRHKKEISEFEASHKQKMPWLFEDLV
jgi:3-isopropylmalate/(R)-2-methylmalate dehydratase small subunit